MIFNKIKNHKNLALLIVFLELLYAPILGKFFEQDEWHNIGQYYYNTNTLSHTELIKEVATFYLPVTQTINYTTYTVFGIESIVPALIVLFLIGCNSALFYAIIYKFSRSKMLATGSVLFGYTSYIALQAVSWVLPSISTQGSFFFMNIAILMLLLHQDTKKKTYILASLLAMILAVGTKFNSFFIFGLAPISYFLYIPIKKLKSESKKITLATTVIAALGYILYKVKFGSIQLGTERVVDSMNDVVANIFILPLKAFSQILVPNIDWIYSWAGYITFQRFRMDNIGIMQTLATEGVSIVISLLVVLLIVSAILLLRTTKQLKTLLFGTSMFFLSFMPYVLDKHSTSVGFLESRQYYIGAFAAGVIIFSAFETIYFSLSKQKIIQRVLVAILAIYLSSYFFHNITLITKKLKVDNALTQHRKEALAVAKDTYINNPSENIILFIQDVNTGPGSSNVTNTYFQTGLLYPFLVYTFDSTIMIPHESFSDDTFWDFTYQGIEEIRGKKIGSFYEYDLLLKAIQNKEILTKDVYAFEFDYANFENNDKLQGNVSDFRFVTFKNITNEIRTKLSSE